jgi:hypothetical protein
MDYEFVQMGVSLLFLPVAAIILFQGLLSIRQLANSIGHEDDRKRSNAIFMLAMCFIAIVLLYRFWFWLMWQLD